MWVEECFLCSEDVSSGTWKTKRRKMTGNAAKLAVQIIDTLATRSFGVTVSSIDYSGQQRICFFVP